MLLSKYNYLLSTAYIKATAHKVSTLTYLDDHRFPNLRRASRFTDRDTNLFKANFRIKRQAKTTIKNIFQILNAELHDSTKKSRSRMVTALIAPKHLCPISYTPVSHRPIFADYFRIHDLMKVIRNTLIDWHSHDLADSIESTQQCVSAYVHDHLIFNTDSNNDISLIGTVLNAIANQYGYTVKIKPLVNRSGNPVILSPSDSYIGDNYQSVARFVQYIYKQYKLPIAYGSAPKARSAYRRFMALPKLQRRLFIKAIENSTQSINLRHHASYRRYAKHWIKLHLAEIQFNLHKFNVIEEPCLLAHSYQSAPQRSEQATHHYTSWEQWIRADKLQEQKNHQIIRLGAERLSKATSSNIHKIIRPNKKAVTIGDSNSIHILSFVDRQSIATVTAPPWFEKRTSGIPP